MTKKFVVLSLCLSICMSLVGCKTSLDKYSKYVSELRTNVYIAESETISAKAIVGTRETPFVMNGISGEKQDFTVITITPKGQTAQKYLYNVAINGVNYKGEFLPHPFENSFSVDFEHKSRDSELALTVICGDNSQNLTLKSVLTQNTISADKAFEIANKKLKTNIKELSSKKGLNAEVYVRLTENPIDNTGGYFWYVAFVGENQEIYAALLNSVSGEISAIRQ